MSKTARFFEIIQILRSAPAPVLAQSMAGMLEVSVRTIYRDIAALQARQVPIYGQAGVGYELRKGYDLPPLNLDAEEAEAVAVGLKLVARTGDVDLWRAAGRASRKLNEVAPGTARLVPSTCGVEDVRNLDLGALRQAIREEQKVWLAYQDEKGRMSERVIWPLVLIYYVDCATVAGWCELRSDLRHFRADRVRECVFLEDGFQGKGAALRDQWEATQLEERVTTRPF